MSTDPIVDRLRLARKTLKLSQEDVAKLTGRQTYQSVWQWENGVDLRLSCLRQWAAALGYDLALVPRQQVQDAEERLAGYEREVA